MNIALSKHSLIQFIITNEKKEKKTEINFYYKFS